MEFAEKLTQVLSQHPDIQSNLARQEMIRQSAANKEALFSANGALATWTPPESTGRSPKDTYLVRHQESEADIDWDSPNNIPMEPDTFDMIMDDALGALAGKKRLYVTDRVLGANSQYALPVKTVTDCALAALFTDNMFRSVPQDIGRSVFAHRGFTLVAVPFDKLDRVKYEGRLRKLGDGRTSNMAVAMDFDRRRGVVFGSAYG
ncbi:MAG: phosphoenolpyruvate carboxykinase (ATP), partial [Anaerolineales bacterium]|nr:phosphoenolpyruvate carboxykinase (ATP) [Anaerolineales bacterium]